MFNQQISQSSLMNKLRVIIKKRSRGNMHQPPVKSIGLKKVWLLQSKTKEHAVVAGLSPLLEISHLEEQLLDTLLSITPSNNSCLALLLLLTMVAMVEECTKPSHMLRITHLRPLLTIHSQFQPGHLCRHLHKHLL